MNQNLEMREVRIKLECSLFEEIKTAAEQSQSFPAVIIKNIVENHYRKNGGTHLLKFKPEHQQKLAEESTKKNMSFVQYLTMLLDKLWVKDRYTLILNPPKNLKPEYMHIWLLSKVDDIVKSIPVKDV